MYIKTTFHTCIHIPQLQLSFKQCVHITKIYTTSLNRCNHIKQRAVLILPSTLQLHHLGSRGGHCATQWFVMVVCCYNGFCCEIYSACLRFVETYFGDNYINTRHKCEQLFKIFGERHASVHIIPNAKATFLLSCRLNVFDATLYKQGKRADCRAFTIFVRRI